MIANLPAQKSILGQAIGVLTAALIIIVSQIYYAITLNIYNHDIGTVVFGVFVPIILGCFCIGLTKQWAMLFGFLGFAIPIVDDLPIKFDWPKINGFPTGVSHDQMQTYLYALSLGCLLLTVWLSGWRKKPGRKKALLAYLLVPVAFVLNYVGDLPFDWASTLENQFWYQLDLTQHILSLGVFVVATMLIQGRPFLASGPSEPPPI
jgi:hypothetical protein